MALTRFYLTDTPSPIPDVAPQTVWDDSAVTVLRGMSRNPSGSPTSVARAETSTSNIWDVRLGQFVSPPMVRAGTLAGGADMLFGCLASGPAANLVTLASLRVVSGDGSIIRGSRFFLVNSSNWPTAPGGAGGLVPVPAGTDIVCEVGDRLVFDVGYRALNTVSTSYTGTLYHGGPSDRDLDLDESDLTRPGWLEIQDPNGLFGGQRTPYAVSISSSAARLSSVTITARTDLVSGDLRLACFCVEAGVTVTMVGWAVAAQVDSVGEPGRFIIMSREVGSAEVDTTATFSATTDFTMLCVNVRNYRDNNPIHMLGAVGSGNSNTARGPALTAPHGGLVVQFAVQTAGLAATGADAVGQTWSSVRRYTFFQVLPGSGSGSDRTACMQYRAVLPGPVDPIDMVNVRSAPWITYGLVIAPVEPSYAHTAALPFF